MKVRNLIVFLAAVAAVSALVIAATPPQQAVLASTGQVCDSSGFLKVATKAEQLRSTRRLTTEAFVKMAAEPNTIVFDARSKDSHEKLRIAGSINLPYTEMAVSTLERLIPLKDTRILIYCRNNLVDSEPATPVKPAVALPTVRVNRATVEVVREFIYPTEFDPPKIPAAGLNIPTFITLYIYGYHNVWELDSAVDPKDSVIKFESGPPSEG